MKMANAIITLKVMPKSPEIDLDAVEKQANTLIREFNDGKEIKADIQPVAFGLKSLNLIFVADESKGTSDELEEKISKIEGVQSVECTDVRRAVG